MLKNGVLGRSGGGAVKKVFMILLLTACLAFLAKNSEYKRKVGKSGRRERIGKAEKACRYAEGTLDVSGKTEQETGRRKCCYGQ